MTRHMPQLWRMVRMKIKCPTCKSEHQPLPDNLPDGTITEICINCGEPFSYLIEDGEVKPWEPPKVNMIVK
jgi:DNA-directed RNA polymerase subunit RPC12/RpoP